MAYRVYGIPNCSTVKKARDWLETHDKAYTFHDYKKSGIDAATLQGWLKTVPLDTLLNRRGTTWRGLDDAVKAQAETVAGAIAVMIEKPSVIKRPVVVKTANGQATAAVVAVGFDESTYLKLD